MTVDRIHIVQGEYATGRGPNVVISTLLGSCVSCCLWDPEVQIGGMNHMLLAVKKHDTTATTLAGVNAMELLINELIKRGAHRDRLLAKAFGGARMVSGLPGIGDANADFTLRFLEAEGIRVVGQSLGGYQARSLRFWPATGRVMQRTSDVSARDIDPVTTPQSQSGNGAELF